MISMATGQGVPTGACRGSISPSAINGNVLSDILKSLIFMRIEIQCKTNMRLSCAQLDVNNIGF